MSGQPVKTHADENRFRNEYMMTLSLQEGINDMNLQANKTYLLTGQLPPSSQMQDTRTNAEKLADVEKMKRDIADTLKPIAEPQFAYQIVNAIINSPLNLNNSLLRFLAQRADSIVDHLKKLINIGIKGDANDLDQIVNYIKDMYAKQQGTFQSVKSYMNSTSSDMSSSKIIGANDIDLISIQIQDIIKNFLILGTYGDDFKLRLNELLDTLRNLRECLFTNKELQVLLDLNTSSRDIPIDELYLKEFFENLEKLPKYNQVIALTNKVKKFMQLRDIKNSNDGITGLFNMFSDISKIVDVPRFRDDILRLKRLLSSFVEGERPSIATFGAHPRRPTEQTDTNIFSVEKMIADLVSSFFSQNNIDITKKAIKSITNIIIDSYQESATIPEDEVYIWGGENDLYYEIIAAFLNFLNSGISRITDYVSKRSDEGFFYNAGEEYYGSEEGGGGGAPVRRLIDRNPNPHPRFKPPGGSGISKRRGRPRGSGIAKVEKPPTFIGFGINEINQRKLNDGILKIRRNTRTSFQDMPSKRISPTLQRIIKTVIGGGMPNYNDLSSLNEEEKEYLHKIVTRSNMEDKLSIPAPSKDQQEKDIHNFEVMKGQIMSGNDSIELVKKFKLLIRKLSKQGLLPKNDVEDIMEALIDLGY